MSGVTNATCAAFRYTRHSSLATAAASFAAVLPLCECKASQCSIMYGYISVLTYRRYRSTSNLAGFEGLRGLTVNLLIHRSEKSCSNENWRVQILVFSFRPALSKF